MRCQNSTLTNIPQLRNISYLRGNYSAMEIIHDAQNNLFKTSVDGYTAYATYIIKDGKLDIRHTIVPPEIGGRGIAGKLVKATYDYALQQNLQPIATCSYAVVWLQRHPEYHGKAGEDYGGCGTCAL